jgi:hypothetical protein
MVAELRRTGGGIILYTDNAHFYKYLKKYSLAERQIPYLQNGKIVGIDMYFDKTLRRTVQRVKTGQMLLDI